MEHREGGDPSSVRKSPGQTKYEAITLERGVTHDKEFEQWANKVWSFGAGLGAEVSLKDFRKDIIIEVYNEAGQLAIAYKVYRCWVSEYQALPDLDANANAVAIQTIKLENEGWERDLEVARADRAQLHGAPDRCHARIDSLRIAGRLGAGPGAGPHGPRPGAPRRRQSGDGLGGTRRPAVGRARPAPPRAAARGRSAAASRASPAAPAAASPWSSPSTPGSCAPDVGRRHGGAASSPATVSTLRFRLPDSLDLLAAERCAGVEAARRLLAERCVVEARRDSVPVAAADLAEEDVAALAAALAAADPGAELLLELRCPACERGWWELLDVADVRLGRGGGPGPAAAARGSRAGAGLRLAGGGRPGAEPAAPPALPGDGERMSDFLGRLAARALGQAPPLGPRPASQFETSPAALSEETAESAPAETAPAGRALTSPALLSPRERREEEGRSEAGVGMEGARPALAAETAPESSIPQGHEPPALKGRHLNSLGLQPQVGSLQDFPNPEGVTSPTLGEAGAETAPETSTPQRPEPSAPKGRPLNSLGLHPQVPGPEDSINPEGVTSPSRSPRSMPPLPGLGEEDGLPSLGLKPQAVQRTPVQGGVLQTPTHEIDEISYFSDRAALRKEGNEETGTLPSLIPRSVLREESARLGIGVPSPFAPRLAAGPAPAARAGHPGDHRAHRGAGRHAPPLLRRRRARPAAPRLGLAEYLRRRGEGRP